MIPVWFILYWFKRMLAEHWAYNWSGAEYGLVSCAGAWVYIFKMWGLSLYHGSNTIWRKHTGHKGTLAEMAAYLQPGWAVFKWRKDGEPEQFVNDGEDDLYHMGCYIGSTEQYPEGAVIEAQGTKTGVVVTSITSGWSRAAEMAKVDYTATAETHATMAVVTAESGRTVNMRAEPSADAVIRKQVPIGAQVAVMDVTDGWALIQYDGLPGYMLERFLQIDYAPIAPPSEDDYAGDGHIVTVSKPEIDNIIAMMAALCVDQEEAIAKMQTILASWLGYVG